MNSDIRYLHMLEKDLDTVATQERDRVAGVKSMRPAPGRAGRGTGSRRPSGGSQRWPSIAAAVVVLLLVAGGVGVLVQNGGRDASTAGSVAQGSASSAPDGVGQPAATGEGALGLGGQPGGEDALTDRDSAAYSGGLAADGTGTGRAAASFRNLGNGPLSDLSKIVRDGRVEVVVASGGFGENVTALSRIARNNGGFVLTSSTQNGQSGQFTLRIPAKRFDLTMEQVRALGTVQSDEVTGQDVTAEFVDLKVRVGILSDRRELLRDLQSQTSSSSEILRYATLIDDVQFEIESIQGQLNFIRDQVAEGTIKVSLRELGAPEAEEQPQDVDNPSLGNSFDLALQGLLRVIGVVVIGLGYLIPLGLIALVAWFGFRLVRRRDREAS